MELPAKRVILFAFFLVFYCIDVLQHLQCCPTSRGAFIIRQNSLSHAVEVVQWVGADGGPSTDLEMTKRTIAIARLFEAYSAGDLDVAIVEAEMKLLTAKET